MIEHGLASCGVDLFHPFPITIIGVGHRSTVHARQPISKIVGERETTDARQIPIGVVGVGVGLSTGGSGQTVGRVAIGRRRSTVGDLG